LSLPSATAAPSYLSSNVSAPTPSSTVGAPSILSPSKAKLSASEINQYVANAARISGVPQNSVISEKVTAEKVANKVAKPKAQANPNEMVILSEASEEDIEASKNYDYNTINDRYLTQVYKQSGLMDKTKPRPATEQTVTDKLPTSPSTLNPINKPNTATPVNPTKTTENLETKVSLDWPLRGAVRSNFGTRKDPINGKHKFHQGVDIAAKRGTPIAAAADGVVVFAGWGKKYGNNVRRRKTHPICTR
jgi:murein DD-endopeptidase MepM/ murein hydrolase activator NlpD